MKQCTLCQQEKPETEFHRKRDGRAARCRACANGNRKPLLVFGAHKSTPDGGLTHDEIGARLGLSRQRVHQIEIVALAKLRASLARMERP